MWERIRRRGLGEQFLIALATTAAVAGLTALTSWGLHVFETKPWKNRLPPVARFGAFSPKGTYFLFEESGEAKADSFYSSLRTINVKKNATISGPLYAEAKTLTDARSKALDQFGPHVLKRFGFQNLKPSKFFPADPAKPHTMRVIVNGAVTDLSLREAVAETDPGCKGAKRRMFTLTAKDLRSTTKIQDDDHIPITRRCAVGYEIAGAFTQGKNLAVAIRVLAKPPLGARYRFIVATAQIG